MNKWMNVHDFVHVGMKLRVNVFNEWMNKWMNKQMCEWVDKI